MKIEYKKVYDLVNSLKFECNYIKLQKGLFSLHIYSKDYTLFEGKHFKVFAYCLEDLKKEIKEVLK